MGRDDNSGQRGGGRRKNKARMNYLKQTRQGGGGGGRRGRGSNNQGSVDAAGYKTGDYVSAYGHFNKNRNKRGPKEVLTPGMTGFLCTTNFRESDCVREAYNLLNEYDDKRDEVKEETSATMDEKMECETETAVGNIGEQEKTGVDSEEGSKMEEIEKASSDVEAQVVSNQTETQPKPEEKKTDTADNGDGDSDLDIDEAMKKEIKELKSERVKRRFQCVDTGVKNVVFINSTVADPNEIACRIFEDVVTKREAKARHILRFLPIEASCRTEIPAIRQLCKENFEKYFKAGYNSFKVVANVRFNSKLSKDDLITNLAEVVSEINPLNVVSLKEPTYTIIAEVLKTIFCVSVVKNFNRYKKFNLVEAATPDQIQPETSVTATTTEKKEEQEISEEIPCIAAETTESAEDDKLLEDKA